MRIVERTSGAACAVLIAACVSARGAFTMFTGDFRARQKRAASSLDYCSLATRPRTRGAAHDPPEALPPQAARAPAVQALRAASWPIWRARLVPQVWRHQKRLCTQLAPSPRLSSQGRGGEESDHAMSAADACRPVSCTEPNYQRGLLERVRLVPCSKCGAGENERCVGQYGRGTKGCHAVRHDDAKAAGLLMGRAFWTTGHARPRLSHVRQVHHELLAVIDMHRTEVA